RKEVSKVDREREGQVNTCTITVWWNCSRKANQQRQIRQRVKGRRRSSQERFLSVSVATPCVCRVGFPASGKPDWSPIRRNSRTPDFQTQNAANQHRPIHCRGI